MSAPLILPKGNDRSWTKEFYRTINKVFRRFWHDRKADQMIDGAFQEAVTKGIGFWRI